MPQEVSAQRKGIPVGWIVVGLFSIAAVTLLLSMGDSDDIQYYMTVSEFQKRKPKYVGKKLKLAGKVLPGSLKVNGQDYDFTVEDLGKQIRVKYSGLVPDTFKEGVEVVVEGKGVEQEPFIATHLMAKCASKYEAGGLPPLEKMRGKSIY